MAILPQSRLIAFPLLLLALALCAGIVVEHYLNFQSQLALVSSIAFTSILAIVSIALISVRRLFAASLCIFAAFFLTGLILTTIDAKLAAPDRLARLFEAGVIAPGDPTELTGVIQGGPALAPQSFYLAVRAETVL